MAIFNAATSSTAASHCQLARMGCVASGGLDGCESRSGSLSLRRRGKRNAPGASSQFPPPPMDDGSRAHHLPIAPQTPSREPFLTDKGLLLPVCQLPAQSVDSRGGCCDPQPLHSAILAAATGFLVLGMDAFPGLPRRHAH